jgi:hypothetical protein
MAYTVYKTNGIKLTTIDDGSLNLTTDLQLVGKNYAGYGQVVNENFVKLLENFANTSAPTKPLSGQLWYDSLNKKIRYYTGSGWNQVATVTVASSSPATLTDGDFFFNSATKKLFIQNDGVLVPVTASGSYSTTAASGSTTAASGAVGTSQVLSSINVVYDVIELTVNDATPAIISAYSFKVNTTDPLISQYSTVTSGVTLLGSDPATGVSSNNNTYFWGTAADTLRLNGKVASDYVLTKDINVVAGNITSLGAITYISAGSPSSIGTIDGQWQLSLGSTLQATYSDLAERYHADTIYEPGTVLVIGGDKEVTTTDQRGDLAVAGIVSTDPAFKMNSAAGNDSTHPYIALKGRVPCKVVGPISKGDMLVTAQEPGYATAFGYDIDDPNAVFARALEDFDGREGGGIIEVKV